MDLFCPSSIDIAQSRKRGFDDFMFEPSMVEEFSEYLLDQPVTEIVEDKHAPDMPAWLDESHSSPESLGDSLDCSSVFTDGIPSPYSQPGTPPPAEKPMARRMSHSVPIRRSVQNPVYMQQRPILNEHLPVMPAQTSQMAAHSAHAAPRADDPSSQEYRVMLQQARAVIVSMSTTIQQMSGRITKLETQNAWAKTHAMNSAPARPALELHVQDMETVWYAERPFPTFSVDICENNTHRKDLNDMKIQVSLVDGFGNDASDKLCGNHNSPHLVFAVTAGTACVNGLRFSSVSSKCGGHFQLVFKCTASSNVAVRVPDACRSARIQVLSYRLYHSPKLAIDKLQPTDSIAKMRGIGALYAQRLSTWGVVSVQDLANFNVAGLSDNDEKRLMDTLRRDRGAMTMSKLLEYVNQAKKIMSKHHSGQGSSKRQRTM